MRELLYCNWNKTFRLELKTMGGIGRMSTASEHCSSQKFVLTFLVPKRRHIQLERSNHPVRLKDSTILQHLPLHHYVWLYPCDCMFVVCVWAYERLFGCCDANNEYTNTSRDYEYKCDGDADVRWDKHGWQQPKVHICMEYKHIT